jgi:hypothetical protein
MSRIIQQQQEWTPTIKETRCAFLLSAGGSIEDPLVESSNDKKSEEFALALIPKAGPYSNPPKYLVGRRLRLWLNYPKIRLEVDFGEPKNDGIYFDRLKADAHKR